MNIPHSVPRKINAPPLHDEDIRLDCKSEIKAVVKILKNIDYKRCITKIESSWYDDRHVEPIIKQFHFFFRQRFEKA